MKIASAAATESAMTRRVGHRLQGQMLPGLPTRKPDHGPRRDPVNLTSGLYPLAWRLVLACDDAPGGYAVAVIVAERPRRLLGERVAVALAVGRPHERGDNIEVPLG